MIRIINADVIDGLRSLPEKSVHCVVTSPPYWGLRDYGVEGQIGLEKTPEEYVSKMVQVFREVRRVLRDDGTIWLNLGDCYATETDFSRANGPFHANKTKRGQVRSLKQKDMVGIPWRVAFALQADGWYLRSDIIWSKPNPMPESVTDRPTKSHEYVFLLTKKARYFYDADAVREKQDQEIRYAESFRRGKYIENSAFSGKVSPEGKPTYPREVGGVFGRNRRTVWEIATQPTPEAHFATFPEALVEPCIKAGTSERGCCSVCGAPWVRVAEPDAEYKKLLGRDILRKNEHPKEDVLSKGMSQKKKFPRTTAGYITIGWQPPCTCSADTIPCTVLDPFGGSGTVAKVARDLNRDAILIEINPAYVEIARRKLRADEQLFENVKVITA